MRVVLERVEPLQRIAQDAILGAAQLEQAPAIQQQRIGTGVALFAVCLGAINSIKIRLTKTNYSLPAAHLLQRIGRLDIVGGDEIAIANVVQFFNALGIDLGLRFGGFQFDHFFLVFNFSSRQKRVSE